MSAVRPRDMCEILIGFELESAQRETPVAKIVDRSIGLSRRLSSRRHYSVLLAGPYFWQMSLLLADILPFTFSRYFAFTFGRYLAIVRASDRRARSGAGSLPA